MGHKYPNYMCGCCRDKGEVIAGGRLIGWRKITCPMCNGKPSSRLPVRVPPSPPPPPPVAKIRNRESVE